MGLKHIRDLINLGKIDQAFDLIGELDDSSKLERKILESRVLEIKGKYKEANDLANYVLTELLDKDDKILEFSALVISSYSLMRMGLTDGPLQD